MQLKELDSIWKIFLNNMDGLAGFLIYLEICSRVCNNLRRSRVYMMDGCTLGTVSTVRVVLKVSRRPFGIYKICVWILRLGKLYLS
jgi:hypothetical protein